MSSTVYFGNLNCTVLPFMQRLLYSSGLDLRMKAIADGCESYGVPERNKVAMTNFIR